MFLDAKGAPAPQVRVVEGGHTATYTALLDSSGECRLGVGDMEIHEDITPLYIQQLEQQVKAEHTNPPP